MVLIRQDLSDRVSVSLASPAFDIACSSEFTAPFFPSAFSNYGWDPQLFLLWIFLVVHEFKPTTQVLTFLLKPDTCIQFPFVGSMISLHSTGLRQNSWSREWHHHCSHHQPLTIPKLSRWSFLSSSCTLSQGDILHDACMCQDLCEVLEGDEQSDMVPDLKSLHSNRGAIQGRKCWVPQERQPRKDEGSLTEDSSHVSCWGRISQTVKGQGHHEKREPGEQLIEVFLEWWLCLLVHGNGWGKHWGNMVEVNSVGGTQKSQSLSPSFLSSHIMELENWNTSFPCNYAWAARAKESKDECKLMKVVGKRLKSRQPVLACSSWASSPHFFLLQSTCHYLWKQQPSRHH